MTRPVKKPQGKVPKRGKAGNKNAEKFDKPASLELFKKAQAAITDSLYFLPGVAKAINSSVAQMRYVVKKFEADPEVQDAWEKLNNEVIATVFQKAADGEIDKATAIFYMKVYHNLLEVQRQEVAISNLNDLYKKAQMSNLKADDQQK